MAAAASEELLELFQSLSVSRDECLSHDVHYMLWGLDHEISTLNTHAYRIKKGMFESIHHLYNEIVRMLHRFERSEDLLELIPFIDDYIEYYLAL